MTGKAVFWLGVLVLLTPHEPDLGLDHPSAAILESTTARQDYIAPDQMELFAANLPRALFSMKEDFLRRAPQIRADIRNSLSGRKVYVPVPSRNGASGMHF